MLPFRGLAAERHVEICDDVKRQSPNRNVERRRLIGNCVRSLLLRPTDEFQRKLGQKVRQWQRAERLFDTRVAHDYQRSVSDNSSCNNVMQAYK